MAAQKERDAQKVADELEKKRRAIQEKADIMQRERDLIEEQKLRHAEKLAAEKMHA